MTDAPKKKRKFKITTPGQERDYERLSADRMFQAYEDAPANSTANVANWDPLLGKPAKVMYKRRRKLNMDTLNAADIKIDGRTKQYREAVRRIKERQERLRERQTKSKLNQFGISENPFGKPVDEIHSPKDRAATDAAIATWKKAGGKTTQLKPGKPKGMDKSRKKLLKREEVEMNKKYLKTKDGSIEDAVLGALRVETPENPNSYRPTLTLPKNKYLETKEGSLERAVEKAMVTEAGATKKQVRMAKGIANDPRHKGGDMTGAWKKAEKIKKGLGDHPKVAAALRKANEEDEISTAEIENMIRFGKKFVVGEKKKVEIDEQKPQHPGQKKGSAKLKKGWGMTQSGEPYFKPNSNRPTRDKKEEVEITEKEVDVKDTRRTVDAIRAYDKSKDASRDADYDTSHGKAKRGDIEKKYAKKERGEIDKDDPRWKHRDYHTGIHGEEKEMSPLIKATMDKIHSMREDKLSYKERQKLPKGDFALPGKGDGPEGKQGGSYPIPDESHARNALARVSQHGTPAEKAKVKAAVEKKFPNIKVSEESDWAKQKRIDREVSAKLIKTHNEREARYQAQQKAKKQSESKETENGERDVGSDKYRDYVAGLTPGQEPDVDVTNKDAKKASSESKKASDEKERQIRKIDDEFITHLESLEGDALEAALDDLSQNELLEVLGTGLVKKAAGAVKKRFSAQGRLAAAKKKGDKIKAKTDLHKQKQSNIAAKAKLKAMKAKTKAAKKPAAPKPAAPAPSKPAAPPKPKPKVKVVPGKGITSA